MEEFIGSCTICKKEIYCINGFLNGLIQPDGYGVFHVIKIIS
ncbi:hypothetical protein [Priestia megaterium]